VTILIGLETTTAKLPIAIDARFYTPFTVTRQEGLMIDWWLSKST
jgi:hypothetical protein